MKPKIHYTFQSVDQFLSNNNGLKIILRSFSKLFLFVLVHVSITFNVNIMKKNMGMADRSIRILIALVIAVLFYMEIIAGTLGIVLLVAAGVFVLTSLISFCPLYTLLGINTCKTK